MALGCRRAFGTGFRGGSALRLGLRTHGTRNAGASRSAEEAGGGWILSIRAESHVPGVLSGMGRAVGGLWTSEPGRHGGGVRCCAGRGFVCVAVRGADAAKNVRRGV